MVKMRFIQITANCVYTDMSKYTIFALMMLISFIPIQNPVLHGFLAVEFCKTGGSLKPILRT